MNAMMVKYSYGINNSDNDDRYEFSHVKKVEMYF